MTPPSRERRAAGQPDRSLSTGARLAARLRMPLAAAGVVGFAAVAITGPGGWWILGAILVYAIGMALYVRVGTS